MGIKLFEHNQAAYLSALSLMEQSGKAAIIHPTGTGKSFIGFKLAEDFPKKRILWLSPSEYIVKTQLENLKKEGGTELDNIKFVTYAKLMLMTSEEMADINPDFVICDEYHRAGAAEWGKGVSALLNCCTKARLLGLSATNIRYLDNLRNMAEELFDGNIASEMTLGEAIARNILPPPEYVISVYAYRKEIQKYEERIDRIKNTAIREKNRRALDALRRTLEMADGLDKVFKKHIKNVCGKYIVFCSSREHMDEMISHAREWFGEIDGGMHIYKVYSDDPAASKDFTDFKKDSSRHLKLLFCIDMLNEGVHVEDIDGVIMFRPTVSPIIYKQQIGRALSAGKNKQPVIFDVVNNFENLYSISSIQEEIKLAVSYYRDMGESEKIVNETFSIIDETCDCRHLFESLEKSLSSTWETYFRAAKAYFEENGSLRVPKRYITEDGLTLGMWIATQRRVKNGSIAGDLTDAQIQRLNSIGMVWDNVRETEWKKGFEYAREYSEKHGSLDVRADYVTESGFRLGSWIVNNRTWYKNNSHTELLNRERVAMLDGIGMIWDKNNAAWESNFAEAERYFREHGNLDVPVKYVTESGVRLGAWINTMRSTRKGFSHRAALTDEQIKRLNAIGMQWGGRLDGQWNTAYAAACEYYEENGNLDIPAGYVSQNGVRLGKWIYNQRVSKKLSARRRALLDRIGMRWSADPWEERYLLAKSYFEEHGNLNISQSYKTSNNIWLGKWLYEQRKGKESLTAEQVRKLNSIGMVWHSARETAWYGKYAQAEEYFKLHGNIDVPKGYRTGDGSALDIWLKRQRSAKETLSSEQIAMLDRLNMDWNKGKDVRYAV